MAGLMNVSEAGVGASAATEGGITAEMATASAAASAALTGVMPMGADADSAAFAAALSGTGTAYLGIAAEHAAQRGLFSGAQSLAGVTYGVTDAMSNATLAL